MIRFHRALLSLTQPTIASDIRFAVRPIAPAPLLSGVVIAVITLGVVGMPPYETDEWPPQLFAPMSTATDWNWQRPRVPSNATFRMSALLVIAARTSGDARTFVPRIRAAIREVEPYATVGDIRTLAEQYASRRRETIQANLAALAVGAAALALASLGLYAIIAFAVAQRTREIGVRLAVGATSGDVVRHFFRGGLKVTAIGLAIGLPVTIAGIRIVKATVIGFTIQNVAAVMVVVSTLIIIAALASWLPAPRAGRVDPLVALRSE